MRCMHSLCMHSQQSARLTVSLPRLLPRRVCVTQEHRSDPRRSKLKRMVPTVGSFFTPLRLTAAFQEYDACFHISRRKFIPPNFAELRHILNIAQVRKGGILLGRRGARKGPCVCVSRVVCKRQVTGMRKAAACLAAQKACPC